jgi:hypothetical protein
LNHVKMPYCNTVRDCINYYTNNTYTIWTSFADGSYNLQLHSHRNGMTGTTAMSARNASGWS